jgi:diketogulonate reductase-like aldo/keto reductase
VTLDAVLAIAEGRGVTPSQVSLAWTATRGVIPILGPRTLVQLEDNPGATGFLLTAEEIDRVNHASRIPLGFPHDALADEAQSNRFAAGMIDRVDQPRVPVA